MYQKNEDNIEIYYSNFAGMAGVKLLYNHKEEVQKWANYLTEQLQNKHSINTLDHEDIYDVFRSSDSGHVVPKEVKENIRSSDTQLVMIDDDFFSYMCSNKDITFLDIIPKPGKAVVLFFTIEEHELEPYADRFPDYSKWTKLSVYEIAQNVEVGLHTIADVINKEDKDDVPDSPLPVPPPRAPIGAPDVVKVPVQEKSTRNRSHKASVKIEPKRIRAGVSYTH